MAFNGLAARAIPFVTMCKALELSSFERDALLMIAAPYLDDEFRDALEAFRGRRYVDASLVITLLTSQRAEALVARKTLLPMGRMQMAGLVESIAANVGHVPSPLEHELVPAPRLLRILDGETGLDPRLDGIATLIDSDPWAHVGVMEGGDVDELARVVKAGEDGVGSRQGAGVAICGPRGTGKLRLARSLAARCEISRLVVADCTALPSDHARLAKAIEGLTHEAALVGGRLLLRGIEYRAANPLEVASLLSMLRNCSRPAWVTSGVEPYGASGPEIRSLSGCVVTIPAAGVELRQDAWAAELHARGIDYTEDKIRELAFDYPISRSAIEAVASTFAKLPSEASTSLVRLAEMRLPGQLSRYARRGRSRARLDQLVLPDAIREQLQELAHAVRNRATIHDRWKIADRHATGRGIVALFNGPPGTGKTMAANALANEMGLPLFRIDTSTIVDRYVGETEKNLTRLFEEALASRATLLFDEADSLFGKRVDAQDAVDRHANMQINVLLNLIEDYDGFVVLTTNMKGALDSAFLRRIVFKIGFDMPDVEERIALWNYHLPNEIPRAPDVDIARLAREFDKVSGGDIKNAVLRAALATDGTKPITQELLQRSMANELRANGAVIADQRRRSSLL